MSAGDAAGSTLTSSSAHAMVGEVEALVASLQAASVEWRDKKFSVAQHMQYARLLCELQEIVTVVATNRILQSLVDRGLVVQCIAMATDHAALGMMSWLTLRTWEAVVATLLSRMHQILGSTSSLAHLVPPVWHTVSKLAKASLSSRTGDAALVASMRLLAILLQYCPVELVVLRRALPHPLRSLSEAARASGYALLPWVAINAKTTSADAESRGGTAGRVASSSSACAYPVLSEDLLEYVRKGLVDSMEIAVRAAATEAVRLMLEAGIRLTEDASHQLLSWLIDVCESGRQQGSGATVWSPAGLSQQMEQDAGVAIGCLLALLQTGHVLSSVPQVLERRDVARWQYVGGPAPSQAARVQSVILLPHMSRYTQAALSTAVATVWRLCVSPPVMADALRAFFMLLVPTPSDSRAYMPHILVRALGVWAQQMPSNQYRAALVHCLRDLLRRTGEARVILHAALLGLQAVVGTLESTRQVSRGLSEDMKQLAARQPSLSTAIAEVMASLATHSPHFRRTLLKQVVATYKQYAMPSDDDEYEFGDDDAPTNLRNAQEGPRGKNSHVNGGDVEQRVEGALTVTVLLLSRTVLALPPGLLASTPLMKVLLTAVVCLASVEPPTALRDIDYRQMEFYFLFAAALLRYHRHHLSAFLMEKLESSTRMFLSLLVGHAATSPAYLRAASAACGLLRERGDMRFSDTVLCVGLLEGQLLTGSPTTAPHSDSLLAKLKGGVFDLVRETQWSFATPAQVDLGSIRWTVTQALNTLEEISRGKDADGGVEVVLADDELFPHVVVPLLGTRRRHIVASTGLPRALAETGHQAVELIAWAIGFFDAHDLNFCRDVVRRLASLSQGDHGSTSSSTNSGAVAGRQAVLWNVMCTQVAVLEALHRLPSANRQRWTQDSEVTAALQQWKAAALHVAQVSAVDLEERLLAAKVVALLLHFFDDVDAFTVSALHMTADASLWPTAVGNSGGAAKSGASSAGVGGLGAGHTTAGASAQSRTSAATAQASGTLLVLAQAHGAVEQPGTFSMAVSLFAESLRRTGLAGEANRSLVLSTLLGVLSLMALHVSDVQDTILDALLAALAVPVQVQVDRLTHSLVLVILTELDFSSEPLSSLFALTARTAVDVGAWHSTAAADVMDGRLQLLCDATASETHQLQVPARAMVLQHLVIDALRESTLAVPFYFPGYCSSGPSAVGGSSGVTTTSSSSATASNSARLAAVRRRQGHTFKLPWSLPDTTTEWIARLSAQCVLTTSLAHGSLPNGGDGLYRDGNPPPIASSPLVQPTLTPSLSPSRDTCSAATLSLLEVSILIDAAATEESRDTWANVALQRVLMATPAETTVYLNDISKVMQARLPDLGELLEGSARRQDLGGDGATDRDAEDGDEDALGVTYGSAELARRLADDGDADNGEDEEEAGGLRSGQRRYGQRRLSIEELEGMPICGDVASKVAYLALLVAVCSRHTPNASATTACLPEAVADEESARAPLDQTNAGSSQGRLTSLSSWRATGGLREDSVTPNAERAHRDSATRLYGQCLEVAVASVPLVETIPELLESAVALLQQLFQPMVEEDEEVAKQAQKQAGQQTSAQAKGTRGADAAKAVSLRGRGSPQALPSLAQWKIPLVAALKTVVQLSIFDSFPACQLVRRFLRCELADDTSARRVTRGLLLLLMALEHLEAETGHELLSKDAGRVVMTLSTVLTHAVSRHWRQTAAVATEGLGSVAGQAALAVLCRDLCCSVGLTNGCSPPADLKVPPNVSPEEGVDASMLLQAAVQLHERPGVTMGPSLRHAVGCLACLVTATDGADLAPVARLVGALSLAQQRLITDVAWDTLETSLIPAEALTRSAPGSRSTTPHSFDSLGADTVCLISEEEEQYLLDILVASSVPKQAVRAVRLVEVLLPALSDHHGAVVGGLSHLPPILELRALLALTLQTDAPVATVARVLQHIHVEMLRVDACPVLVEAAVAYVSRASVQDIIDLSQTSAAGCALMERVCGLCARQQYLAGRRHGAAAAATANGVAARFTPLSVDGVQVAVVERLREALHDTFDPRSLVQFMWPRPAQATRAVVVCLSVLAAEPKAVLVVKAGPAMCDLFLQLLQDAPEELLTTERSHNTAGAAEPQAQASDLPQRILMCVALLTNILKNGPHADLLNVVLQPVGVALMRTVAKQHPAEMRAAIQKLGPERALVLRGFMEQSSLATTTNVSGATR